MSKGTEYTRYYSLGFEAGPDGLGSLLEVNELLDSLNHPLDQLHLRGADAALVGDVELAVGAGGGVLSASSTGLRHERQVGREISRTGERLSRKQIRGSIC